jgi:transcriptional regulator with XRE-family HTH domain
MSENETRQFGERVRHFRTLRGMSQKQLAATVDRSHSMVAMIEQGRRQIHVDELVTFAYALNVPPTALLGSDDADHYAQGFREGWEAALSRVHSGLRDLLTPPAPSSTGGREET